MNIGAKVCYITVGMIRRAVILCVLAQKYMPKGKSFGIMIWGESGIGKNANTDNLHLDFSKKTGQEWGFIDCNLSAIAPEDITGLPKIVNGETVYCPKYNIPAGTFGIFRVDEMDRPAYFQNLIAMAKFAIDKTVEKPLPDTWVVIGLANGSSDVQTQELTKHLKGRFCHFYASTNSAKARKEIGDVLTRQNMPEAVLKLAKVSPMETPDEFEEHAVYNHRALMYAGAILKAYEELKAQGADVNDVLLPALAGVLGRAHAVELLRLYELQGLPTLDEVLANPAGAVIPEDLSLRHKFVSALVHEAQEDCQKATRLMDYLVRMPKEVARYAIETLATACPEVCKTKAYTAWFNRTAN